MGKKDVAGAQGHVTVMCSDRGGERNGLESGGTRCGSSAGHLPFKGGDVGAVNVRRTSSVVRGHWAVADEILCED
jgi:hypothetical protein